MVRTNKIPLSLLLLTVIVTISLTLIFVLRPVQAQSSWRYAYITHDNPGITLWLVDPDSMETRSYSLPNPDPYLESASVSPDGKKIMLWFNSSATEAWPINDPATLRLLDLPTGELHDIVQMDKFYDDWGAIDNYELIPRWSPDGQYISHVYGVYNFRSGLNIPFEETPYAQSWSSDSQWLATGNSPTMWLFQMPEMTIIKEISNRDLSEICDFDWSPDNKIIVFEIHCYDPITYYDGYGEVMAWDLTTDEIIPLTDYTISPLEYYERTGYSRNGTVSYSHVWLNSQELLVSVYHWDVLGFNEETGYLADPETFAVETTLHKFPGNHITQIDDEWHSSWTLNPVDDRVVSLVQQVILKDNRDVISEDARTEIATFDGTQFVVEQTFPWGYEHQWSLDGQWLAFIKFIDEDSEIHSYKMDEELVIVAPDYSTRTLKLPDYAIRAGWIQTDRLPPLFFPEGTPTPVPTFDPNDGMG